MYIPEIPDCSIKPILEELVYIAEKTHNIAWHHSKFQPPASEADIAALEQEINLQLPSEYRELLKFSNGFEFYGISSEFYGLSGIRQYYLAKKADWFPQDYVIVGELVGDGEVLCFSKETGKFLRYFDGEEQWLDSFPAALQQIVSHIRMQAEEQVEL